MREYRSVQGVEERDLKEIPQWMLDALLANGEGRYLAWGNHEDYMSGHGGWDSPIQIDSPESLWPLDELNELVNFYFTVYKETAECPACEGYGYNSATLELYKGWYSNLNPDGTSWKNSLEQSEVQALYDIGKIPGDKCPTAVEYNAEHVFHDSVSAHVCVKARAKRLGVFGECTECGGDGIIDVGDGWRLGLQMWFLHPRKGASRGVFCSTIQEDELPNVYDYLCEARKRNLSVFANIPEQAREI